MPSGLNRISRFWRELKRRKVVHLITVYASAAFVIIELINNLAEPLNLPSNLLTIVVIILAVGFPLAVILSWIYDLTGEGIERTKPLGEIPDQETVEVHNVWKIATYVSFAIIIGFVSYHIISGTKQLRVGDIQSLVVLPFENYTGDDQLEYMVSGMHALLIGDMGRISGLRVTGRTSSKIYKEVNMSAKDIAKELNVDAVLEATVMCLGDSVCMQFRLVNTTGEEHQIWVGDYHEDKGQILNLYNQIAKQIAQEVKIELTPQEKRLLNKRKTIDKEAFDAYLNSYAHWDDMGEEGTRKAIEYLNLAIEKDPEWAPLWSGLAQALGVRLQFGFESPETALPKAYEYLNRALELDPDYAEVHFNNAIFGTWIEWNWEKGEQEFLQALAINPSDAMSRVIYAHLLSCLQRGDEALTQGKLAVELDPFNPTILSMYGAVLAQNGKWEASLLYLEKAIAIDPDHYLAYNLLDNVAYHCGEYDEVFDALRYLFPFEEKFWDSINTIYQDQGFEMAYEKVLDRLELHGGVLPSMMANRYKVLHQYDKVLDWLERGYEMHDSNMPYILTRVTSYDSIYYHPRFMAIIEKMNLPLPTK